MPDTHLIRAVLSIVPWHLHHKYVFVPIGTQWPAVEWMRNKWRLPLWPSSDHLWDHLVNITISQLESVRLCLSEYCSVKALVLFIMVQVRFKKKKISGKIWLAFAALAPSLKWQQWNFGSFVHDFYFSLTSPSLKKNGGSLCLVVSWLWERCFIYI